MSSVELFHLVDGSETKLLLKTFLINVWKEKNKNPWK